MALRGIVEYLFIGFPRQRFRVQDRFSTSNETIHKGYPKVVVDTRAIGYALNWMLYILMITAYCKSFINLFMSSKEKKIRCNLCLVEIFRHILNFLELVTLVSPTTVKACQRNYCADFLFHFFLCICISKNSKYYFLESHRFKVSKTIFGLEIDWVHAKLWAIKNEIWWFNCSTYCKKIIKKNIVKLHVKFDMIENAFI